MRRTRAARRSRSRPSPEGRSNRMTPPVADWPPARLRSPARRARRIEPPFSILFQAATQQRPDCVGRRGGSRPKSGSTSSTEVNTSAPLWTVTSGRPVSISSRRTPKAQRSLRLSAALPAPARDSCTRRAEKSAVSCALLDGCERRRMARLFCHVVGLLRRQLGQAEVEHLHDTIGSDLDVGGLQIAMDDAAFVRRFKRLGDGARDGQRFGQDWGRVIRSASVSPSTSSRTNAGLPSTSA